MAVALVAAPAVALSIFDIIQLSEKGYSDERLIGLIEATDSVFELEAEDVPRLQELGVNESVIRVMLSRVPAEPEGASRSSADTATNTDHHLESDGPSSEDPADRDSHGDHDDGEPVPAGRVKEATRSRPAVVTTRDAQRVAPHSDPLQRLFSYRAMAEERAGHHLHALVTIADLPLLVIRDEAGHASPEDRAGEVALKLEKARSLGDGSFRVESMSRGHGIVFQAADGQSEHVLTVTASDAGAYELRSGRSVPPGLLARYWSDLLSDFWALTVGRMPGRMMALHEGEALGILYQALSSSSDEGGDLWSAARLLPTSIQHHLERLAVAVPVDYDR